MSDELRVSAPVVARETALRIEAEIALAEAQAEIARLTERADRMEAALRDIVRLFPRSGAAWVARAALTDKPDAGEGE